MKIANRPLANLTTITLVAFLLSSCAEFNKSGVGTFLGLTFGDKNTNPIKVGPRNPPFLAPTLSEFYEIDFPNLEFDFVGVALTKNSDSAKKAGITFKKEGLVWGAFFSNTRTCGQAEFDKTINYIKKNWKVTHHSESTVNVENSQIKVLTASLLSDQVFWRVECFETSQVLEIQDFSVLEASSTAEGKNAVRKIWNDLKEIASRKMT